MISKVVLALMLAAASAYGGAQLIEDVKPAAEVATADATIRAILSYAQLEENLGLSRPQALAQSILESPDAEGIYVQGDYVIYNVIDSCRKGTFGDYYKKVIVDC
jgi:hypothetical protein